MELRSLLKERQLSVYQCAKESHVPYTTLSDIVKGKTRIEKCTAETLYKLAKTLNVTMEELLTELFAKQVQEEALSKQAVLRVQKDEREKVEESNLDAIIQKALWKKGE